MTHGRGWIGVLLCGVCVTTAIGCGSAKIARVPVEGVVTYKGAPAANVMVGFVVATGATSMGRTDEVGKFNITGVPVGNCKITVKSLKPELDDTEDTAPQASSGADIRKFRVTRSKQRKAEKVAKGAEKIPIKFANAENSGLTATVSATGDNVFNFNLE